MKIITFILLSITFISCKNETEKPSGMNIPSNFHMVEAVTPQNNRQPQRSKQPQPMSELQIEQTQFFSYVMPQGWRVGENGQFALTLVAPDNKAFTVLVGNSGLMPGADPAQFVYQNLSAMQPQNLQLGQSQPTTPIQGFQNAFSMEFQYQKGGETYRGVATSHVISYYGGCVMAMTAAIAENSQWPSYSNWLPKVSTQVAATNGAAFGMRGLMAQNLKNSIAFGEAAKEYRAWSQQNWQKVTDDRNASTDRQNAEFRENLGAIETYDNPYGNSKTVELSTQYQYYWTNKQGKYMGTNDPGANPNSGGTEDWTLMQKTAH